MPWSLVLDLLVAALLAACIVASLVLDRRLARLRSDSGELEKLTRSFQEATDRADHGASALKGSVEDLQERLAAARALVEDLQFLIERGGSVADRIENEIRAARRVEVGPRPVASPGGEAKPSRPSARAAAAPRSAVEPRSAAELHLLASLHAAQG
ncbi:MAG: DUF6468 domain-containing protein [Rhodospirillales bacterium]